PPRTPTSPLFPYTTLFRSALAQVILELRRVVDLLEEGDVPVHGVLGHVGGAEDAAEHQVLDVDPQCLLHGRDVLPVGVGDTRAVDRKSTRLNSSHQIISYA